VSDGRFPSVKSAAGQGRRLGSCRLELVDAEARRPIDRPDARDYILRGRAARLRPPSPENRAEAIGLLERALALDQQSVAAQSWLAIMLTSRVLDLMTATAAADIVRAEALAERALAASPRSALAHFAKGQVFRAQHRNEQAIRGFETVIALNRNWAHAYAHLGQCKLLTGSIEETIPLQDQDIRLSPRDPQISLWYYRVGLVHLLQSCTEEAIPWLERARNVGPGLPYVRACLASADALKGETERAAAELAEARKLSSDDRYSSIRRLKSLGDFGVPKIRALYEATYFAGLREAGMPEE
jgi:adenylate cyclase